ALGGCRVGDAKITAGFELPAQHVIHAVGPVWSGGTNGEPELLASCYARALEIAAEREIRSIAFPCISSGAYGYPIGAAARIAVDTVRARVGGTSLASVIFCCHSQRDLAVYEALLARA